MYKNRLSGNPLVSSQNAVALAHMWERLLAQPNLLYDGDVYIVEDQLGPSIVFRHLAAAMVCRLTEIKK